MLIPKVHAYYFAWLTFINFLNLKQVLYLQNLKHLGASQSRELEQEQQRGMQ